MKLYSVTAQVVYTTNGWHGSVQVPAFLLSDRQVQSTSEAEALARKIVDPLGAAREVHVSVVELGTVDQHGNLVAQEGCDRCTCGCKYWEHDRCIDCGTYILDVDRGAS